MATHESGRRQTSAPGAKPSLADRRAAILKAATRRFAEFGFEATTVRQLADDVNVLSGSLYHHFATKDELLHEIVRDAVLQVKDNAIRIARAPLDAEHRLIAMILLDLGELIRNQDVHAILSNERRFFRQREEFAYVVQAKREAYHAWRAVLQDGIDAKLFKPGIDIYLTISTIVRMLNIAVEWYATEDATIAGAASAYTLEQAIDFHLNFVLNAVRALDRVGDPVPRLACEELARFRA